MNNHISTFIAANHGTPGSDNFARAESKEQFFRELGESLAIWAAAGQGPTVDLCTTALIAAFNFGFSEALGPVDLDARINLDGLPDIGAALDANSPFRTLQMVRAEAIATNVLFNSADRATPTGMYVSVEGPNVGAAPVGVVIEEPKMADDLVQAILAARIAVWG